MANENKEIGEIVKKCKILLLDIEGTTTSISFVKDKLFPYVEEKVKQFLESQWETDDVKDAVSALRKLAIEDQESKVDGVVTIPGEDAPKEEQIEGLVNSVKWQMSSDRKVGALKQLQGLIWKQGYDSGDIKGHVYDDVSAALKSWHNAEGQKVYIYSSGSVQAQKLLFGQSLAGNLLGVIDGHFDTAVGVKQEASSYTNIVEKIGCKPEEILFLTDIVKEAEAARAAGLHAALVSRDGNAALSAEATAAFPVLRSLSDLAPSYKRKPDPQEEETPAKILKTDSEVDVKDSSEAQTAPEATPTTTEPTAADKMEVEETANASPSDVPMKEQVTIEEITDSNEAPSVVSVCDLEPVVEEEDKKEKTDKKKETESVDQNNKAADAPAPEETPPASTVVTEIEDVSDKPLTDTADVMEDNIVPVVEESEPAEDMEVLHNVGEVLEKECDDILAKVQDVTNLDNIPVKPLLNTITEETMETDNTDSNDIVDRILDTELDLEMKQCTDIDLNTVAEIAEEVKTDNVKANGATETTPTDTKVIADVATADKEANDNSTEKKSEDSNPTESEPQETKLADVNTSETETKKIETEGTPEITKESCDNKVADVKNKSDEVENKSDDKTPAKETEKQQMEDTPSKEPAVDETKTVTEETKPTESVPENGTAEKEVTEVQVNGNGTSGDSATAAMNGDASKEDELSARLSVGNGKVNGANGDAKEKVAVEAREVTEVKVKSVPAEETRTDPIEQPTQA